jgi:hypothetical protein
VCQTSKLKMGHSTTRLVARIDGFNEQITVRFLLLPVGCAHRAAPSNGGTTNKRRVAPMSHRRNRQRGLSTRVVANYSKVSKQGASGFEFFT